MTDAAKIARGLTKALSRPKVRRAINDIQASEYGWCKRSDGLYHNLMGSRYMQYDPRLRRIMRVHGWGESFQVWPWEHWAIMLAVRALDPAKIVGEG